jgi:hypothetical protein
MLKIIIRRLLVVGEVQNHKQCRYIIGLNKTLIKVKHSLHIKIEHQIL